MSEVGDFTGPGVWGDDTEGLLEAARMRRQVALQGMGVGEGGQDNSPAKLEEDDPSNIHDAEWDAVENRRRAFEILKAKSQANSAEVRAMAGGTAPGKPLDPTRTPNAMLDLQHWRGEATGESLLTPEELKAYGEQADLEVQNKLVPLLRQQAGSERPGFVNSYAPNTSPAERIRGTYDQDAISVLALPDEVLEQLPSDLKKKYLNKNALLPDEQTLLDIQIRDKLEQLIDEQGAIYYSGANGDYAV